MADQSFSPENLKSIYDNENKKGKYLEGEFFPHIKEMSKAIKNLRKNIYILKKDEQIFLLPALILPLQRYTQS